MEYLGQASVAFDVRPKRAGYLVDGRARDPFRQAVLHASTRWGGVDEPIVPVTRSGLIRPLWRQILKTAEPDVIFDTTGLSADARASVHRQTGITVVDIERETARDSGMHQIGVISPSGVPIEVVRSGPDVVDLVALGDLTAWADENSWLGLGRNFRVTTGAGDTARAQLERTTLLETTILEVGAFSGSSMGGPPAIWIVGPRTKLTTLLHFWNARALQLRDFGMAPDALIREDALNDPWLPATLRRAFLTPAKHSTPDLNLVSFDHTIRQLAGMRRRLRLTAHPRHARISRHIGAERTTDNLTACLNANPYMMRLDGERRVSRATSTVVTMTAPETVIRVVSPIAFSPGAGGRIRVGFGGESFQVPRRPAVATLFHDDATWHQGRLELETNPHRNFEYRVRFPSARAVVMASIAPGIDIRTSAPGQLGEGLLSRARRSIEIAVTPEGVAIIEALTTPRTRAAAAANIEAPSTRRQVERSLQSIASRANLSRPRAGEVLGELVDGGLAIRGLLIVCEICGLRSFVAMEATTVPAICPGCSSSARYEAPAGEPELHYRLNTLLDRASDQGVLPHLFAWSRLPTAAQDGALLGADVHREGRHVGEVDLVAARGTNLVVGEAKRSAAGFVSADLATHIALTKMLGGDVHQLICLEPVPNALRQEAEAAAERAGLRLEVVAPD